MAQAKTRKLKQGLGSLLSSGIDNPDAPDSLSMLPMDKIIPGRYQPRSQMDDAALEELAESIRAQGVIQPIIVRESGLDDYELIAGERRWRAAQLAGLNEIPAVIKSISDENALAIGLIENIQRENLNPIEEAQGLKRLVDEFGMTHESVAQAVGRSRSSISNSLRLLSLPEEVQDLLWSRHLEMGHARALITLDADQQITLATKAAKEGWSVREVERKARQPISSRPTRRQPVAPDPEIERLQQRLADALSMDVSIHISPSGQGRLCIRFASIDELNYLFDHLGYTEDD